jgi:Mg2+-importing ATPase
MAIGVAIPFTHAGRALGLVPPPGPYWPLLALTLAGYVLLTQTVKTWLSRRGWI